MKDDDKPEVATGGETNDKPEYDENTKAFIECESCMIVLY